MSFLRHVAVDEPKSVGHVRILSVDASLGYAPILQGHCGLFDLVLGALGWEQAEKQHRVFRKAI